MLAFFRSHATRVCVSFESAGRRSCCAAGPSACELDPCILLCSVWAPRSRLVSSSLILTCRNQSRVMFYRVVFPWSLHHSYFSLKFFANLQPWSLRWIVSSQEDQQISKSLSSLALCYRFYHSLATLPSLSYSNLHSKIFEPDSKSYPATFRSIFQLSGETRMPPVV